MPSEASVVNDVLRRYGRFIVHMRRQISDKRFGLVLGAGASRDLGFPDWETITKRISAHAEVDGANILGKSGKNSSVTQLLYQKFKTNRFCTIGPDSQDSFNKIETAHQSQWRRIVHECLYCDVPEDIDKLKTKDEYLQEFLALIKKTRLTINYNFDDTIQRFLSEIRSDQEKEVTRGYCTVWSDNIQMAPRDGVIYHPNGFLPRKLTEKPSEQLVFLEDTFADQLIASMSGRYASLSHHYSQNTCLFLGLSLDDATLKHQLRQGMRNYPGHHHYFISYIPDEIARDDEYEKALSDSNFDVYNLNTLFLTKSEIAALGCLLGMSDNDFLELAEELGEKTIYRYFVVGCVCAGKTTAVNAFQSLVTHDEWLEDRPSGMEKDPSIVADDKVISKIDEWVFDQVGKKNKVILREKDGVHIMGHSHLS